MTSKSSPQKRPRDGSMALPKSQSDKFKEAAREHETDENEARWEERLKKVAKAKQRTPD
jgi:hypothetical protein